MDRFLSRVRVGLIVAGTCLIAMAGSVNAQLLSDPSASNFKFSFATPGARSLGLGGAFLGLADDATAAYVNPAGLVILSRPEVSAEGRRWSYSQKFTDSGNVFGSPTGQGVDNVAGLVSKSAKSDVQGLAFTSFVYPGKRWAVAVYRHELADQDTAFRTNGVYFNDADGSLLRLLPVDVHMNLKIVDLGISGAFRINDNLFIGVGISDYQFILNSQTNRANVPVVYNANPGEYFGVPNFDPSNIFGYNVGRGDDTARTFSGGILWNVNSKWTAGAVYRPGPKFSFTSTEIFGPASGANGQVMSVENKRFHVPDVLGGGISFRPSDVWTIAADYDRVRYSNLSVPASKLIVDDGNEVHLGIQREYVVAGTLPVAFRVGGWIDPDHQPRFSGVPTGLVDRILAVQLSKGKNEIHYSAGLGLNFSEKFQIDTAFDGSSLVKTASLSGIFRF
jgi:long-chain fatty acid transport protein